MMVEGEMEECSEEEMAEAIKFAHEAIKTQIEAQMKLAADVGAKKTREYDEEEEDLELEKKTQMNSYDKCYDIAKKGFLKSRKKMLLVNLKKK